MIPYSDQSEPNPIFPYINLGLIAVNFLVFVYELSLGTTGMHSLNAFIGDYGLVPCEYTNHCLPPAGAPNPIVITFVASMFMHAGWLHLLGNMLFLFVFGDNIENSMGHARYLLFYLLCGFGANILEIATTVSSASPGLGASGAIAGILAAYLLLYPSSRVSTIILFGFIPIPLRLPAWLLIGFWFILQFFNGLVALSSRSVDAGGIAYWAHIGGFGTGLALIWFFRRTDRVSMLRAHPGVRRA